MTETVWKRLGTSIPFLCLAAAIAVRRAQTIPTGPWDGIYTRYVVFWLLIGFASALMILAVQHYRIPWAFVVGFILMLTYTLTAHSFLWHPPWGPHDAWRHLHDIKARQLSIRANVYPAFHILVIALSEVIGVASIDVLSRVVLVSATAGTLFATVVVTKSHVSVERQQMALLVIAPSLVADLTPRPVSLALPFLFVGFWFVLSKSTRLRIAAMLILPVLVVIHPFIATLLIVVFTIGVLCRSINNLYGGVWKSISFSSIPSYLLIAVGVELVFVLFVGSGFSLQLATALAETIAPSASVANSGPAGVGLIAEAFSSPEKFREFLLRSSYLLALTTTGLLAVLVRFWKRNFEIELVLAIAAGLSVFLIFLLTAFLPAGVGINRIFIIAPLFFLPLLPAAFSTRTRRRRLMSVCLAVLVLTAGIGTVFTWPAIGGVEYSATEPQVSAVVWVESHASPRTDVIGTLMTHWILSGLYSRERSAELSRTGADGMIRTLQRDAQYSWEVPRQGESDLFVIDGVEQARARVAAAEGDVEPVVCEQSFRLTQDRIFHNGDTELYVGGPPQTCAV